MIVGFQYLGMTITGSMHLVLGILCFIISMVTYSTRDYYGLYMVNWTATLAFLMSLWIVVVGIFGILAGRKTVLETTTRRMKIVYMVLAILSACLFSICGMGVFSYLASIIGITYPYKLYPLFCVGSVAMFFEFILAIISSSICCCCSSERVGVVVLQQNHATEFVNPATDRGYTQVTHVINSGDQNLVMK